jgi:general secretion pathway protein G
LVELLVVIAIIGILASLTMVVITKIMDTGDRTKLLTEISQLAQACETFKLRYGRYPPSRIVLIEQPTTSANGFYHPGNLDHVYSVKYLQDIFTGIHVAKGLPSTDYWGIWNPPHAHDWNGDGELTPGVAVALEGDQCLVYFLGGIPQVDPSTGAVGLSGFCTDKTNPTRPTPGRTRDGPFYEFQGGRVKMLPPPRNNGFPVYLDRYGTPYAYFLARSGNQNNYCKDCPSLCGPTFVPYIQSQQTAPLAVTYYRPQAFQIISAGRDRMFGTGGLYVQGAGATGVGIHDRDNMTNFGESTLGTGR